MTKQVVTAFCFVFFGCVMRFHTIDLIIEDEWIWGDNKGTRYDEYFPFECDKYDRVRLQISSCVTIRALYKIYACIGAKVESVCVLLSNGKEIPVKMGYAVDTHPYWMRQVARVVNYSVVGSHLFSMSAEVAQDERAFVKYWEDIRASNIVEHVVLSEIESGKKNALQLYCDINTRYCEIEKYLMSAELKGYDSVFVAGIDAE